MRLQLATWSNSLKISTSGGQLNISGIKCCKYYWPTKDLSPIKLASKLLKLLTNCVINTLSWGTFMSAMKTRVTPPSSRRFLLKSILEFLSKSIEPCWKNWDKNQIKMTRWQFFAWNSCFRTQVTYQFWESFWPQIWALLCIGTLVMNWNTIRS